MNAVTSRPTSLWNSTRAELLRLRKWPTLWVLIAVLLALALMFGYVFDYIAYATGSTPFRDTAVPRELLLAGLLPDAVPAVLTLGMPMFAGAIMLVLGALTTGNGYGWGAWKTIMIQGPVRRIAFAGTLVALVMVVAGVVTALFVAELAAAVVIASVESQPVVWPVLDEAVRAMGGGFLILGMWTATGALIGALARSPALAVGLGLVWQLVVENLLRGVSALLSGLGYVTDYLPGTAAGSMAGALSVSSDAVREPPPGVVTTLDGTTAGLVLALYLAVFVVAAGVLTARRDIA